MVVVYNSSNTIARARNSEGIMRYQDRGEDDDFDQKTQKRRNVTEQIFGPEQVIEAFQASMGSVMDAARALQCERSTLYNYCKRYPEVQAALDDARGKYKETCVEFARDNHLTHLMDGEKEATAYELAKLEPKPDSINIDPNKLTLEEIATLRFLLEKGKPDGASVS